MLQSNSLPCDAAEHVNAAGAVASPFESCITNWCADPPQATAARVCSGWVFAGAGAALRR